MLIASATLPGGAPMGYRFAGRGQSRIGRDRIAMCFRPGAGYFPDRTIWLRKVIMRSLFTTLIAMLFVVSPMAMAATLDLSDLSCKQFVNYNKENTGIILTWLDAYYLSKDDPAVIDFDRMAKNGAKLEKYCSDHLDTSVSKAAEKVMGQ
jgi:acid stress chaperone HdeB